MSAANFEVEVRVFNSALCEFRETDFNDWINRTILIKEDCAVRYYEWAEDIVSDMIYHSKRLGFSYIHPPHILTNKLLNWLWAIYCEERRPFTNRSMLGVDGTNWVFPRAHSKHRNMQGDYELYHHHFDTEFALDFMNMRHSIDFSSRLFNVITALIVEFFYAYLDTVHSRAIINADAVHSDIISMEEADRAEKVGWSVRREKDDPYLVDNSRGGRQEYG